MPELGRRILSALTAATLALAILFSSTPSANAAAFPFAPRVSTTPATLEMKVDVALTSYTPHLTPGSVCHAALSNSCGSDCYWLKSALAEVTPQSLRLDAQASSQDLKESVRMLHPLPVELHRLSMLTAGARA